MTLLQKDLLIAAIAGLVIALAVVL